MPHPCVVCGRSRMNPNNRAEDYIFFGFPVNDEPRCKKWLEFCSREELYKLTKKQLLQRMVCCKHFVVSDFINNFYDRLTNLAVPSIYDPKQSLYNITCVLCGRFRKDPPDPGNENVSFHHFPGEEFRCLDWLDFVGVESYYRLTRKEIMFCYICSNHFDKSKFIPGYRNRLKNSAVPNIKNPDEYNETDEEVTDTQSDPLSTEQVELFSPCTKDDVVINPLSAAVFDGQVCAACNRSRSDPKNKVQKFRFHPFPAYEIGRCLKWCQFLGREDILKMSPNQIRRLVLCSGHFQLGQLFANGSGPCDAVPTIHDYNNENEVINDEQNQAEADTDDDKFIRPAVSSKKPKMDPNSKPTPLAKKRGKSKRPTMINLPKVQKNDNFVVKKVPIPTVNNWRLISNQFQPITLQTNNVVNNMTSGIKKVILPISGNISNLGAPIPVDSLSSIPPGLLIKINLPEQDKTTNTTGNIKQKKKVTRKSMKNKVSKQFEFVDMNIKQEIPEDEVEDNTSQENVSNLLEYKHDSAQFMGNELLVHSEEIFDDDGDDNFEEIEFSTEEKCVERIEEERAIEEVPKLKMTARCKRTLIPIQNELRRFIRKIKPQVKRLPKKSQAKVKLAIINMVIERL